MLSVRLSCCSVVCVKVFKSGDNIPDWDFEEMSNMHSLTITMKHIKLAASA